MEAYDDAFKIVLLPVTLLVLSAISFVHYSLVLLEMFYLIVLERSSLVVRSPPLARFKAVVAQDIAGERK